MVKYLSFYLFFLVSSWAKELPQTFHQLATPLYYSAKPIQELSTIQDIKDVSKSYLKELEELKQYGFKVDNSRDKKEKKNYLLKLRKLQKDYQRVLFCIHQNISKSIDKNDYLLFSQLTKHKLDGLLRSTALCNKSLDFYAKKKQEKKIDFLEEKIKYNKLELESTKEFFNVATTQTYDSTTKNTSKRVRLEAVDKGKYIVIYIQNLNPYTITLKVKDSLKNFHSESYMKNEFVLSPGIKKEYMRLFKEKGKFEFSYSFSYTWIIGSIDAVHDDSYIYRLPYTKGSSRRVTQGYNGTYTHKGHSKYAIDFGMPVGTKVHAARGGVVVKLKENSNKGGFDKSFSSSGNYVTIEHADATLATYYHLKKNGVVVHLGDKVSKGDFIAYSGNTGYSSGPHLHLSVFKASSATRTHTIPIKFMSDKGVIDTPEQGVFYTAK